MNKQSRLTPNEIEEMVKRVEKRLPTLEELEKQHSNGEIDDYHYWDTKSVLLPYDEVTQVTAAGFIMKMPLS